MLGRRQLCETRRAIRGPPAASRPALPPCLPPFSLPRSHGLNELMFFHFQATLLSACDVLPLDAEEDYRRLMAASAPPLLPLGADPAPDAASPPPQPPHPHASYFFPLGTAAEAALEAQWRQLALCGSAGGAPAAPADLPVMFGRSLRVGRAAGGAAWFRFEELCGRPLGSADYLAVAAAFHTVFLAGVPALSMQAGGRPGARAAGGRAALAGMRSALCCGCSVWRDQLPLDVRTAQPPSPRAQISLLMTPMLCVLPCRCETRRAASSPCEPAAPGAPPCLLRPGLQGWRCCAGPAAPCVHAEAGAPTTTSTARPQPPQF